MSTMTMTVEIVCTDADEWATVKASVLAKHFNAALDEANKTASFTIVEQHTIADWGV